MSTGDELLRLLDVTVVAEDQDLIQRAADEIENLQAKLDAVRGMCQRRLNPSVTTGVQLFAGEVLAVIEKGGGE